MNKKNFNIFKILSFTAFIFITSISLNAAEINKGLVIIDKEPWKTSWVQDDENSWRLISWFEKGKMTTYFKKGPSSGLGVESDNKPIKQELEYFPTGKIYKAKELQFEQWPDGAKAYTALYDNKFKVDEKKYCGFTTAIIQEVNGASDEIRYAYMIDF